MGFTVNYAPVSAIASAAQQIGAGKAAQRYGEIQHQDQQRALDRMFQAQQGQQNRMADVQRMMLGATINSAQDERNFAQQKEMFGLQGQQQEKMFGLQSAATAKLQAEDDARAKAQKEWEMAEEQRAWENKADITDKRQADKINSAIMKVQEAMKAGTIREDEGNDLIFRLNTQAATGRQGVLARPNKLAFPQLPENEQPGMPPFPMRGQDGKPVLRSDGSPILMTTEVRNGVPQQVPFEDPVEKQVRDHKLKVEEAQVKARLEQEKRLDDWIDQNQTFSEDGPPDAEGKPTKVERQRSPQELAQMWKLRQQIHGEVFGNQPAPAGPQHTPPTGMQQQVAPIGPNAGGGPGPQPLGPSGQGGGGVTEMPYVPPQVQQAMAAVGQSVPELVANEDQYNSLPPGVFYVGRDGKLRQKRA